MRGKLVLTLVLVPSLMVVGAAAPVAAHGGGNDTGASGHCSDDSSGGGGAVGVNSDGEVDATNPGEIQSIAAGLQHYGEQRQEGDNGADTCDGGEGEDSYDYLEAHVGNGDQQVQFCFSEDTNRNNPPVSVGQGDQCENPSA